MAHAEHSSPPRRLRALADPSVIGWPLFWASYALFTLDRLPVFGETLASVSLGQLPAIAWSTTVTQLALFAVLLGARFTYLSTPAARRHPSWTVVTFLVAAVIGDVVGSAATAWMTPVLGSVPGPNALGGAWVKAIAMCVLAIILAAIQRHRAQVTRLITAQQQLQAADREVEQALADERRLAVDQLQRSVNATLMELATGEPAACVASLRTAAEEVIRPLSHELASQPPDFVPRTTQVGRPAPWRSVLAQVPTTPLIRPLILASVITLLASRLTIKTEVRQPAPSAAATTLGPVTLSVDLRPLMEAMLVLLAIFAATWLAAAVIRRLIEPVVAAGSLVRRWGVSVTGLVLIGLCSQGLVGVAFWLPGFPPRPDIPISVNLLLLTPVLVIALIDGIIRAISLRQSSLREELAMANDELAWEIARGNLALWQSRHQLSRAIHGPLQAALNAGAITIDAALRQGTIQRSDIEGVAQQVRSALEGVMQSDGAPMSLRPALDRIQRMWDEVCRIEAEIPAAAEEAVGQDLIAAQILIEVVSEACANAVIHGQAAHIQIIMSLPDSRSLLLSVVDNGSPHVVIENEEGGLGTRILDDVALSWSRDATDEGTRLTVRLPIGNAPDEEHAPIHAGRHPRRG